MEWDTLNQCLDGKSSQQTLSTETNTDTPLEVIHSLSIAHPHRDYQLGHLTSPGKSFLLEY